MIIMPWRGAFLGTAFLFMVVSLAVFPLSKRIHAQDVQRNFTLDIEHRFQDYAVRIYSNEIREGRLEVFYKGKPVYRLKEGGMFSVEETYRDKNKKVPIRMIGRDITGNGVPDLVITEYSGGAHCCYTYHIFEMGRRFREIASLGMRNSVLSFEDIDGDGELELIGHDDTFAYWHAAFAFSPAPRVILHFKKNRYVLAAELMRRPAPSARTVRKVIREVQAADEWKTEGEYPPDLWGFMLDLIYTGHADLAWKFFDQAWPEGVPGKKAFLEEFHSTLESSQFWPQLKEMNRK